MGARPFGSLLAAVCCLAATDAPAKWSTFVEGASPDRVCVVTPHGLLDEPQRRLFVTTVGGITALDVQTGAPRWTTEHAQLPLAVVEDGLIALRARPAFGMSWVGDARVVLVRWDQKVIEGPVIPAAGSYSTLLDVRIEDGVLRALETGYTPSGIREPNDPPHDVAIELATGERSTYSLAQKPPIHDWKVRTDWGRYEITWSHVPGRGNSLVLTRFFADGKSKRDILAPKVVSSVLDANPTAFTTGFAVFDPRTGRQLAELVPAQPSWFPVRILFTGGVLLALEPVELRSQKLVARDLKGHVLWTRELRLPAGKINDMQ